MPARGATPGCPRSAGDRRREPRATNDKRIVRPLRYDVNRKEACALWRFLAGGVVLKGTDTVDPARSSGGKRAVSLVCWNVTGTLSGDRPRGSVCRRPARSIGDVGKRPNGQPVSRYGTAPTRERIRSARPARAWASAMAIITASASPTRVFILASPRM